MGCCAGGAGVSFQLEDGTGLADSNSYGSFAGYVAYWLDRGVTVTDTQTVVEAALVKATDYLGLRFRWRGYRLLPMTQALDWPRCGVYTLDGVYIEGLPVELVKATYEYGFRAVSGDLMPDPTVDASGVTVVSSKDKVGPIEVERTFSGSASSTFRPWPAADRLLRHLIYPETGRVWRA